MSEIFSARLASGEHVIGEEIYSVNPQEVKLEKALFVNLIPVDGGLKIQFIPVSPLVKQPADKGSNITIGVSQILYKFDFDDDLVNNYKQTVSSIQIVSANFTGR